jgi:hypothetical protein
VRAAHNRCLPNRDKQWPHATEGALLGEIEFALAARPGAKARTVRQQLWARRVELNAGKGKVVHATCVVAREYGALAGVKPIEWPLLTNREATSAAGVVELIDWYRARWEIEMLFNVRKNGCKVEELQLGAIERVEPPGFQAAIMVHLSHQNSEAVDSLGSTAFLLPALPTRARALPSFRLTLPYLPRLMGCNNVNTGA